MRSSWIAVIAVVVIALVGVLWLVQIGGKERQKAAQLPELTEMEQEEGRIRVEVAGRDLEVESLASTPGGWSLFVAGDADGTELDRLLEQSAQLFQGLSRLDAEFSDIGLLLRTDELKDVYGNTLEDLPILEIGLSRQTLERIDWNGFEPTDFERVADRFWVHDAIRRLAAEKAAQDQVNTGLLGQTAGAAGSEGGSNE